MSSTLRKMREAQGLTLLDLSHRTGIDPGLLSRYETGTYIPGVKNMTRLCMELPDLQPNDFYPQLATARRSAVKGAKRRGRARAAA